MKFLLQPFVEYYENCEDREKIIILFGLPILLVLMIYLTMWEPLTLKNNQLKKILLEEQQTAVWFDQQKAKYANANLSQSFDWQNNSLPTVIERTLREQNLNPWKNRIFQDVNKNTVVSFNEIPYKDFANWLTILEKDYQIQFENATLDAIDKPARVNSKVVLSIEK